jgi:superfamily II DNA or RNA helicase
MTAAERRASETALRVPDDEERLILATGRYIGEGFDDPRLDTLFLTMPISWEGTLAQYVGRLHRQHHGKTEVLVVNYVDEAVPMLARQNPIRFQRLASIGFTAEHRADGQRQDS